MKAIQVYTLTGVWWLVVAAVLGLSYACGKVDPESAETAAPEVVAFGAYVSRDVATRATVAGVIDNASLASAGFGVFGYHTVSASYSQADKPDFMYNTKVTNPSGSTWTYSPLKYWPNQYGAGAESHLVDRVSFFAYAPQVDVDPDTGELSGSGGGSAAVSSVTGITRLSRSIDSGDPAVTYRTSFLPDEGVDLCWGLPKLNVVRPVTGATATPVSFQFHHSLAALNVQLDAAIDELAPGNQALAAETRIYVRSITFEGFTYKGILNLNSAAGSPQWSDYSGGTISHTAVTVHDGRLDGLETLYDDPAESPVGLHADIVQQGGYNTKPGVTHTTRNLFASNTLSAPVFVIPNGFPLKVTIEYDVETRDDKLTASYLSDGSTHGSVTRVCVRQTVAAGTEPMRLQAGKKYVLLLHLGMTGVKFEAGLTDVWAEDTSLIVLHPVTMGQEVVSHTATEEDWR